MVSMHRTQVQFTEEQIRTLRVLASAQGRSIADVVRESVDLFAAQSAQPDRQALLARARAVAGRFRSGVKNGDVSRRHDDYLAETFR